MIISTFLFIVSLLGAAGVYAYKQYLLNTQVVDKQDLVTRETQFNVSLIQQLQDENIKIDTARALLKNHLALSQIFNIIGQLTIADVRFTSFDAVVPSFGSPNTDIKVTMQGYGSSLSAVAFQSDVLGRLDQYGLRNIVKNPILSNPTQGTNGTVSFGFSATIDPTTLSYENTVTPAGASSTGSVTN